MSHPYHCAWLGALLVLLLWSSACGQEAYDDVVLLDNGAIVQGKLVSDTQGEKIKIEREDGYVVDIPAKRIRLITKAGDPKLDSLQTQIARMRPPELELEWTRFGRVGFLMDDTVKVYALTGGFGLVMQSMFTIAAEAGWEHWQDLGNGIPFALEFVGQLLRGETVPYWYFDIGVLPFFPEAGKKSEADFFFGFGLGVATSVGEGYSFSVLAGYRAQSFVEKNIGLLSLKVAVYL